MKHKIIALAIAVVVGVGAAVYDGGTEAFKHPVSYAKSFAIPDPVEGQTPQAYVMMYTIAQGSERIGGFGGMFLSASEKEWVTEHKGSLTADFTAMRFKMDREFPDSRPVADSNDTRTFMQKLKGIPTYEQARAMPDSAYSPDTGYIDSGVHVIGAEKPGWTEQ